MRCETRRPHRLLGPRPHRASSSWRSCRRPSGSATTPSGRRRRTAPTPRRCSPGSPPARARSGSARRSSRSPRRSAAMTAMTAATIDKLSNGRMRCGIGASGPQVAEGWHGQRYGRMLQRTREYVAVMRMALARERVEFHGETLELPLPDGPGKALKLTIAPVQERIPIYLAAIGPKNTALAGEIADGWIPTLFAPEHVAEFRTYLQEGADRAGQHARRLRHRADRQRARDRRPRERPRRDAPLPRALHRRDGLARAELLQPPRRPLRLRGGRARRSRTSTWRASARRPARRCRTS